MLIDNPPRKIGFISLALIIPLLLSCSHKYASDILDLAFYQWNQWPDLETELTSGAPTCGWEVLHRGNGNLVRIPASITDYHGVSWYHCRFTLPELWEHKKIALIFEGAGPEVEVYLNEKLVGTHNGSELPFSMDITDVVYYTLDNHLAIRINDPDGGGGITGTISAKSSKNLDQPLATGH